MGQKWGNSFAIVKSKIRSKFYRADSSSIESCGHALVMLMCGTDRHGPGLLGKAAVDMGEVIQVGKIRMGIDDFVRSIGGIWEQDTCVPGGSV